MGTGKLKYLSGGQNKNKNLFWNNTLIFSCFACLGAPYLQGR
jgi:hypothetical protein